MTWRTAIGLKPTAKDLAQDLIAAAAQDGLSGWQHHAENQSINNGDHVVNLANIHLEYAAATRAGRRVLLKKYLSMLKDPPMTKLWSLAQTKIYPLLRSHYDRIQIDIDDRRRPNPSPRRAGRRLISHLDQLIGYDNEHTITQVNRDNLAEWGVTLGAAIERALTNLRALSGLQWHEVGQGVWELESPFGYVESLLQVPRILQSLPARGTPLLMIPNRGVLLATGSDEPNGLTALLAHARQSLQEKPWPLCGDLFRIGADGIQLFLPSGSDAIALASIQRLDRESIYAAQKTALEAHCEAIEDPVFVATYGLRTKNEDPNHLQSACTWTQGISILLPKTDLIAFVWNQSTDRKLALAAWEDAAAVVGHYFKATDEDPTRIRVDEFPNAEEMLEIQKRAI